MSNLSIKDIQITPEHIETARKVREEALQHLETMRQVAARDVSNLPGPGNRSEQQMHIGPIKLIYTILQTPKGWFQHISWSARPEPTPAVIYEILEKCWGIRWNARPEHHDPQRPDICEQLWQEPIGVWNMHFPYSFANQPPAHAQE